MVNPCAGVGVETHSDKSIRQGARRECIVRVKSLFEEGVEVQDRGWIV